MDAAGVVLLSGLVFWVVIATLVGGLVGSRKGRGGLGALLGFLLGWIGVLIIAIMKPSQQFEEQKTIAQAKVLREALGGGLVTATPPPSSGVVITPEVRQDLMLEAIRRDPSLAASSDPETLKRLGDTMEALEKEYVLKAELDQLKATQEASAAAAEEAAQNQKVAEERTLAAAAVEAANQLEAARKAEQRAAEIAAMSPVRRFIAKNPAIAVVIALLVVVGITVAIFIPVKSSSEASAAARRTSCEVDVDPTDSLIGTSWVSPKSGATINLNANCKFGVPSGNGSMVGPDFAWHRDGSTLTVTRASDYTPRVFVLKVQGDTMTIVSIEGREVTSPGTQSLYTYTRR